MKALAGKTFRVDPTELAMLFRTDVMKPAERNPSSVKGPEALVEKTSNESGLRMRAEASGSSANRLQGSGRIVCALTGGAGRSATTKGLTGNM